MDGFRKRKRENKLQQWRDRMIAQRKQRRVLCELTLQEKAHIKIEQKRNKPKFRPKFQRKKPARVAANDNMSWNSGYGFFGNMLRMMRGTPPEYKSAFDNAEAFEQKLKKKGFKKLGGGCFSSVWGKDGKDRVIKVTGRPDGWMNYILWAAQNGYCGTLAPRVYSFKVYPGIVYPEAANDNKDPKKEKKKKERKPESFSVAVVERLEKTLGDTKPNEDIALVPGLIQYAASGNKTAAETANKLVPGVTVFMDKMKSDLAQYRFDLHYGNFMLRKDGSFVVTDPIVDDDGPKNGYTHQRLKLKDLTPEIKCAA